MDAAVFAMESRGNNMRKFKMLILSISVCLLCGCGQGKDDAQVSVESSSGTAVEMTEATTQPTTAPTPEPTMEPPQETEGPKEILIQEVVLSNTEMSLTTLEEAALAAQVVPEDTTELYDIMWSSSDESVVTVSSRGEIRAVGNGTATVTVTATTRTGEHTGSCEINVSNPTIATAEELLAIPEFKEGVVYEIVADIDMKGVKLPEEKACIEGVLEGNGHRIYNLEEGPLFEDNEGIIRNLILECDIHIENREADKNIEVATLVVENDGTIERCIAKGTISAIGDNIGATGIAIVNEGPIYQCGNEVDFTMIGGVINPLGVEVKSHYASVGGISLDGRGLISECYNAGDITFTEDFAMGNAAGIRVTGHDVENCYNIGNLYTSKGQYGIRGAAAGTVKNCCNFGEAEAGIQATTDGYVIDCYFLDSKSEENAIAETNHAPNDYENTERIRVHELSDSEALFQESYTALDFENVWIMSEGGYPMLRWQLEMQSE